MFAVLAVVVLAGCSRAVEESSEKGLFSVEMKIEEGILKKGKNVIELRVRNEKGNPVEGAELGVTPWMPGMDHGTKWVSRITEKGNGVYRTNVPLTMGGHWELTFRIRTGEAEDTVLFDFPDVKE